MSPANPNDRQHRPGMGGQSHGSRKGLGGDPPNGPVEGARRDDPRNPASKPHGTTEDQIGEMESEGQGQEPPKS